MTVSGPLPVSSLRPANIKMVAVGGPPEIDLFRDRFKEFYTAEVREKQLEKQSKEKVHSLFKIDGKIAIAQYKNGWSHIESDYGLVRDILDKARTMYSSKSEYFAPKVADDLEAALRAKYGSRLSVSRMENGLEMNRGQLMAAVQNQRSK